MRPKEPDQDEATTPIGELRPSARKSGLCVRVTVDGQTRTLTLPEVGVVTVGRSRDADVFIDHASVSRRHVRRDIRSFERDRIQKALQDCGGNQTKAARMLGISRRTLVSRLTEYGLPRPKK